MILLLSLCLWFGQSQQSPTKRKTPANAQQQTSPSVPSVTPIQNGLPSGNEGQQRQDYSAHWTDPLVLLQLLLFFAVAVQAGIYVWQALLMRRTLRILERQAQTFDEQKSALKDQLEVMRKSFVHTLEMNTSQLGQMIIQSKAMVSQAETMNASVIETRKLVDQNERAVKAAEDSVEIGQRAYVLISSAKPEFNSDTHIMVEFEIMNYGNTPANYVRVSYRRELLESEPENLDENTIDWDIPRSSIIAPHSPHPVPYRIQLNISPEQRRAYNVKTLRLYFWGIIRYRDIFGEVHHTRFRRVHFPGQGPQFGDCQGGNEAD